MSSLRSCDRCYKIKAKCEYDIGSFACIRCFRLDHKCETKRAILQPGRPKSNGSTKRSPSVEVRQSSPAAITYQISLSPYKSFADNEISLVEYALHPDQIASIIYGKSSQADTRIQLFTQLTFAGDLFRDAFLVFAKAIRDNSSIYPSSSIGEPDAARASRALIKLTDLETSSVEDAENALGLALLLITFNDLKIGSPTLPISRAALLRASSWQQQLLKQSNGSKLVCLMFIEIFECIVLGLIPVFRYQVPTDIILVDTYYGIAHYLLPSLYDICVIYNRIKSGTITSIETLTELDHIYITVSSWDATSVIEILELEDGNDIRQHLILQAEAFQAAVHILLLQAYRSTITNLQAKKRAGELSHRILEARRSSRARPKYLLFPFFVACLELYRGEDGQELSIQEAMNDISNFMAPRAVSSMISLLQYIWRRWQRQPDSTWFQVVEAGIPVAMGP